MVRVIFQLWEFFAEIYTAQTRVFTNGAEALSEDGEFFAGDVVLLNRLANNLFRDAVGVDIR